MIRIVGGWSPGSCPDMTSVRCAGSPGCCVTTGARPVSDTTVVIPTIPGRERLLARSLASVDAQERAPFAVIVEVDTGRTGAAATRNRALEKVTTRFVAWLDDDDQLLPAHLRVLEEQAALTGADLVYPGMVAVGGRDPLACP